MALPSYLDDYDLTTQYDRFSAVNHEAFAHEDYFPKMEKTVEQKTFSEYYKAGGVEVIDVIRAKLTPEQYKGYLLGNIIKYSLRYNWKGQAAADGHKVKEYSVWLAESK